MIQKYSKIANFQIVISGKQAEVFTKATNKKEQAILMVAF